jgi:hypothetical protein
MAGGVGEPHWTPGCKADAGAAGWLAASSGRCWVGHHQQTRLSYLYVKAYQTKNCHLVAKRKAGCCLTMGRPGATASKPTIFTLFINVLAARGQGAGACSSHIR